MKTESFDQTKRRLEEKINHARWEWEATVDSIDQIVLMLDAWGNIVRGNRAVESWGLAKVTEIKGIHFHQLFHPNCADENCFMKNTWSVAQRKLLQNQTYVVEKKDPLLNRYLFIQFRPIFFYRESPSPKSKILSVGLFQDISQSQLVMEQAKQAETEMKSVFDTNPDSFIRVDSEGTIHAYKGGRLIEDFFITQNSIGKKLCDIVPHSFREHYLKHLEKAQKQQKIIIMEFTHSTSKGNQVFEARFIPIFNNQVDIINRNITEKKRLLTMAETMNLMENLGYIFSGIRHEIGNPINTIKMTASVLKNNLGKFPNQRVLEYIERILTEIHQVEYLLKNLKNFNMFEELNLMTVQLSNFINRFLTLIEKDFKRKGIQLDGQIPDNIGEVYVDSRALHQVLLNLLNNASDALEGVKNPKISFSAIKIADRTQLKITDNGRGIPESHMNEIFKPFFTTKSRGTGLGLNIVQKIISRMGGTIEIESHLKQGTTVSINIPTGNKERG